MAATERPEIRELIERSIAANRRDFEVAPLYNHKERDRSPGQTKTYQVTMIEGSPYHQLIAMNGKPLPPDQAAEEQRKQQQATEQRRSESQQQREKRIRKYQSERQRDSAMMEQLTRAFTFTYVGESTVRGFRVYILKAIPNPDYRPPSMELQVLTGMQGELWIDQDSCQWVKVTARVIRPVSIGGFLAQVEPGTQFELEKAPVANGVWLPIHFATRAQAKVLMMFNRLSHDDETYFDYQPAEKSK
jgi:hypothetical protein